MRPNRRLRPGTDGLVKTDPGGPEAASGAEVYLFQTDVCTQTRLLGGFGFAVLAPDAFQIDEQFTAATLTATIEWSDLCPASPSRWT